MMLSCREATRLMSEALDRSLKPSERIRLYIHVTVCAGCRNFGKHMHFIRDACRRFSAGPTPGGDSKD